MSFAGKVLQHASAAGEACNACKVQGFSQIPTASLLVTPTGLQGFAAGGSGVGDQALKP